MEAILEGIKTFGDEGVAQEGELVPFHYTDDF
jgi:hypothetical protein